MKFQYEGKQYRIVFRHDKSRDLSAHECHRLAVGRSATTGKLTIGCVTCRNDNGTYVQLYPLSRKKQRATTVEIQERQYSGEWLTTITATSKLNVKHGDKFNRWDGREAALAKAVGDVTTTKRKGFSYEVWRAYFVRKANQKAILEAMGL